MAGRARGRVLFRGVTASRRILGFAAGVGSAVINEFESDQTAIKGGIVEDI